MPKPLKTERLYLRPLMKSDYAFIRSLHEDTDVMKYIGAGVSRTEAQTREIIDKGLQLEASNPLLGAWVAELKSSQIPIGNLILRPPATDEKTDGLEIGFSFVKDQWGKGYATEASQKIIEYALQEFGKIRIVALIDPENASSRNALRKLGFITVGMSNYVDPANGNVLPTEVLDYNG